jgi:hypothetical protein
MKLRYFVVDPSGQLRKVTKAAIEGLWRGQHCADHLGCAAVNELRLVSVLCDRRLLPRKVYLLRVPLSDGWFTEANLLTLRIFSRPDCVTPREVIAHHTAGWPADFFRQLAVVLDVPVAGLGVPLGIGGPLFTAAKLRVTLREAVRYLR